MPCICTQGTIQSVPINLDAAVDLAAAVLPRIAESLPTHRASSPEHMQPPIVQTRLSQLEDARESADYAASRLTELLETEPEDVEEYDV